MDREEHRLNFGKGKTLHINFACDEIINQPIQQLQSTLELPLPLTYSLM
ncbi:MAG: hypothetical protein ACJAUP_003875 [Cellvibrionaceae bacterium]|jgi:hypothetical protein